MKKPKLVILYLAIILILLALFSTRYCRDVKGNEPLKSSQQEATEQTSPEQTINQKISQEENVDETQDDGSISVAKWREFHLSANQPINFYGLVLDQYDNPVPDVRIEYYTSAYSIQENGNRKVEHGSKVSNAEGLFTITGYTGLTLVMESFAKDGYRNDASVIKSFS